MYRIRRFGVLKTATTVAVLYMVVITIFLIPFALLFAAVGSAIPTGASNVSLDVGGGMVVFGLVVIVFYGVATWVFTAISCALYNLVAGWVGGVEIQLDAVAPPPPVPTWSPSVTSSAPPSGAPPVG